MIDARPGLHLVYRGRPPTLVVLGTVGIYSVMWVLIFLDVPPDMQDRSLVVLSASYSNRHVLLNALGARP